MKAVVIGKNKVQSSFSAASQTYDDLATLQREVGLELLERFTVGQEDHSVLDVGCGTGFLTQQVFKTKYVDHIFAVDIAFSMLRVAQAKLPAIEMICADAESLPLQQCSIDKIVSNVALQWCQNLPHVFLGFSRVLKKQGRLIFSTFGPRTLGELKQAWAEVDEYSHVNTFYSGQQLHGFLQQAGFNHIQVEKKIYQSNYLTVLDLMRELKGIGAHNVLEGRNRKMTRKGSLQKMIAAYEKKRLHGVIPATYEIIFVSASLD